jgi:hypothetical protein
MTNGMKIHVIIHSMMRPITPSISATSLPTSRCSLSPALRRCSVVAPSRNSDNSLARHEYKVMHKTAVTAGYPVQLAAWHYEPLTVFALRVLGFHYSQVPTVTNFPSASKK